MKKYIVISVIACVTLILLILFLMANGFSLSRVNYFKMEELFQQDKEYILKVKNYLINYECSDIYIHESMKSNELSCEGTMVTIDEEDVIDAIYELQSRKYSLIGKNGNTVYFQRWSNLDSGRGIAYSVDGNKVTLQYLTKAERMAEQNWYYYEEDYNEWRKENITNGIPNYILGTWNLEYSKIRTEDDNIIDYSTQNIFENTNVTLTFEADGTFDRITRTTTDNYQHLDGKYVLSYDNVIRLQYGNGLKNIVQYIPETQKMVCYTYNDNDEPIAEFYTRQTET